MIRQIKKWLKLHQQKKEAEEQRRLKNDAELQELLNKLHNDEHLQEVLKKFDEDKEKYDSIFIIYF